MTLLVEGPFAPGASGPFIRLRQLVVKSPVILRVPPFFPIMHPFDGANTFLVLSYRPSLGTIKGPLPIAV